MASTPVAVLRSVSVPCPERQRSRRSCPPPAFSKPSGCTSASSRSWTACSWSAAGTSRSTRPWPGARGLQPPVPRELGDQNDVVAVTHQVRHARMTQHVRRQPQTRASCSLADHQIDGARGEAAALRPDEQRRLASVDVLRTNRQPRLERCSDRSVQRNLAVLIPLPRAHDEQPLARRYPRVADVQRDELAEAQRRVQKQHHDRPVARLAVLGRVQQRALLVLGQRARRGLRQGLTRHDRGPQPGLGESGYGRAGAVRRLLTGRCRASSRAPCARSS